MKYYRFKLWTIVLLICFWPLMSFAQSDEIDDLYSDAPDSENNTLNTGGPQLIFSGLLDFRLVQTGEAISWEKGGRGLTRYGGLDTGRKDKRDDFGDRESVTFQLPQASLVLDAILGNHVSGFLQFNYDDHFDSTSQSGHLGLVEGFVQYERDVTDRGKIVSRLGLVIPPISLEHPNTAWSTEYTITPSAINTWVGEELRMLALEVEYRHNINTLYDLEFLIAPFSNNDPSGSILTWRGWALHDYQLTTGARLKTQTIVPENLGPKGGWVEPIKEIDGRMGYYAKLGLSRAENWKVSFLYHDSAADQIRSDYATMEYAWHTTFSNVSLEWTPMSNLTILAQGMDGNTQMGEYIKNMVDNDFSAWYTLMSYQFVDHRFSIRYDAFRVKDLDETPTDNNNMEGIAHTAAYLYNFNETNLLGAELLHVQSERRGFNEFDPQDDPDDDLFQLMYRLTF